VETSRSNNTSLVDLWKKWVPAPSGPAFISLYMDGFLLFGARELLGCLINLLRVRGFTVSKKEFQNGILLQNRLEHPPLRLSLFNLPITVESGVFTSRHCYRDALQMIENFYKNQKKD